MEHDTGSEPLARVAGKLDGYRDLAEAEGTARPVLFWLAQPGREPGAPTGAWERRRSRWRPPSTARAAPPRRCGSRLVRSSRAGSLAQLASSPRGAAPDDGPPADPRHPVHPPPAQPHRAGPRQHGALAVRCQIHLVSGEAGRALAAAQGRALAALLASVGEVEVGQGEEVSP